MAYFETGQLLNKGQYQIIETLGHGGFGITYLAEDTKSNSRKKVCIKTINVMGLEQRYRLKYGNTSGFDQYLKNEQEKFASEAMVLASFDHPHIVKVQPKLFQENDIWCMVMAYIKGKNLERCLYDQGNFSEQEGLNIIQQIGSALQYIHNKNYLHRDIKPQNILIRDEDQKAILIDFGLAREVDFAVSMSLTNAATPPFAPPEQFEKRSNFTPALDIYSLGATLYVLIAVNEEPFIPLSSPYLNSKIMLDLNMPLKPPKELNNKISDQVNNAILKAMEFQVKNRPQSMEEWFTLLRINVIASKTKQSIKLISTKAIDYRKLDQLLAQNKWKEADQETTAKILEVTGKNSWGDVYSDDFKNFSKEDLQIMDQLWVKYSQGLFGFSVQKQIYINCGGTPGEYDWETYKLFAEKVGWKTGEKWLYYSELTFNTNAPLGNLPWVYYGVVGVVRVGDYSFLLSNILHIRALEGN